ncbi:exodeoxyribonuclease V, partial [Streptomyces lunaelactis]|nr:exodeoxyribonuclease V [Streptomyces lunaelactis]
MTVPSRGTPPGSPAEDRAPTDEAAAPAPGTDEVAAPASADVTDDGSAEGAGADAGGEAGGEAGGAVEAGGTDRTEAEKAAELSEAEAELIAQRELRAKIEQRKAEKDAPIESGTKLSGTAAD